MPDGFKELLDNAITRNIKEIKQPIEVEIRKIFSEKIEELNLVRKSELETLVENTLQSLLIEKQEDIKSLIKESLINELIPEKEVIEDLVLKPQKNEQEKIEEDRKDKTPIPENKPIIFREFTPASKSNEPESNISEFISSRTFTSRNQQFRAIAYYLTKKANIIHFNIKDLRDAYRKANLKAHSNFGITARDNVKSGFFAVVPEKKEGYVTWKITEKTIKEFD